MSKYTADQLALLAHLEANKAETLAWVAEKPESRWAGYATTDLDHWAESGIFTVAQYERSDLETEVYELYKEVHGIKPRWMDFASMSDDELKSRYDSLCKDADRQVKIEEEYEAKAIEEFEAGVARTIEAGAGDRETAIRWMRDDEDQDGQYEYDNGLPYGYLAREAA